MLKEVGPEAIVHLAGFQSVADSWRNPNLAFRTNTGGTAALLRGIESVVPGTHLVLASSAAVYGNPRPATEGGDGNRSRPFEESDPVAPESPYGASKAAAEVLAAESAVRTGLPVTIARLFNQFGAEQPEDQIPAGFAASIAAAEAEGRDSVTIEIGNPGARRDWTDTRDTARALRLLVEGRVAGRMNLCSGRTRSLTGLVEGLSVATRIEVEIDHRPERANRNDVDEFSGSPARLEAATGWKPRVPLEESLSAMLEFRRRAVRED